MRLMSQAQGRPRPLDSSVPPGKARSPANTNSRTDQSVHSHPQTEPGPSTGGPHPVGRGSREQAGGPSKLGGVGEGGW